MDDDSVEAVEFLRERAGEHLRWVLQYRGENLDLDRDVVYVRDDVEGTISDYDLERIARQLGMAEPLEHRRAEELSVGSHHVTVRMYDEALAFHFPQDESVGTLVTLDVDAAGEMSGFVADVLSYFNRDDPERIAALPRWG